MAPWHLGALTPVLASCAPHSWHLALLAISLGALAILPILAPVLGKHASAIWLSCSSWLPCLAFLVFWPPSSSPAPPWPYPRGSSPACYGADQHPHKLSRVSRLSEVSQMRWHSWHSWHSSGRDWPNAYFDRWQSWHPYITLPCHDLATARLCAGRAARRLSTPNTDDSTAAHPGGSAAC